MFAKPRVKKSILPPRHKKRKNQSEIEEISFDNEARLEFLTGFHKRKQQRIKHAQDVAAKRAKQEKLEARKVIREERKVELEEHVRKINRLLKASQAATAGGEEESEQNQEWDGFADEPNLDIIDHQEEYVDEDRYTTVTVETVSVTRDGFEKPTLSDDEESNKDTDAAKDKQDAPETTPGDKKNDRPRKKKKQFRYETKFERSLSNAKQRVKKARRGV